MHKRSARSLHLNGSIKSGATSLFGGGGSLVLPTANNAGTIFKVSCRSDFYFQGHSPQPSCPRPVILLMEDLSVVAGLQLAV